MVGLDRKTVRRYVDAATESGLIREATEDELDDALIACECRKARPCAVGWDLKSHVWHGQHPVVALTFLYKAFCRVLQLIRFSFRTDIDLAIEVIMLRQEVAVLRRQVHRPTLRPADRAVLAALAHLLPRQRLGRFFVQPETLPRWPRDLVAKRWTYPHGRPGRPVVRKGTTALILRLARRTRNGATQRIQGELATMGIPVAASSVWAILKRHNVEPSPRRSAPSWPEFLSSYTQAKYPNLSVLKANDD